MASVRKYISAGMDFKGLQVRAARSNTDGLHHLLADNRVGDNIPETVMDCIGSFRSRLDTCTANETSTNSQYCRARGTHLRTPLFHPLCPPAGEDLEVGTCRTPVVSVSCQSSLNIPNQVSLDSKSSTPHGVIFCPGLHTVARVAISFPCFVAFFKFFWCFRIAALLPQDSPSAFFIFFQWAGLASVDPGK